MGSNMTIEVRVRARWCVRGGKRVWLDRAAGPAKEEGKRVSDAL